MRAEFANAISLLGKECHDLLFLTGDLGFMALEQVRDSLGDRFINCGISEQNMVSMAAALAKDGFTPIIYSITPFITSRPYEQIRNDISLHNMNVKIVGIGGGYGYGIMGSSHHALEDIALMRALPNMTIFVPTFSGDVTDCLPSIISLKGPAYLRLNMAVPKTPGIDRFAEWRQIKRGSKVTLIVSGPVIRGVLELLEQGTISENDISIWTLGVLPFSELPSGLIEDIMGSSKVVVVEEHYRAGGVGEALASRLLELATPIKVFRSLHAKGYPSGRYGSQRWHQEENALAGKRLGETLLEVLKA